MGDLVLPNKIVIIGANAAGVHAANAAHKTDPKAEITLIERESYPAYSRCGIPYVLAGEIPSFDDLTAFPPAHYRMMKFDLRLETKVRSINPDEKTVLVEDKEGNSEATMYDSLILSTGAGSFTIPIEGRGPSRSVYNQDDRRRESDSKSNEDCKECCCYRRWVHWFGNGACTNGQEN